METTFIYGLFDPRNGELRYIGKSDGPRARLKKHIYWAKTSRRNQHNYNWIRQLLDEGLEPAIEILEEVPTNSWEEYEQLWIAECRRFGLDLTNRTDGGGGPNGYQFTQESKQKMRLSHLGKTLSEESKRKLSESHKGKNTWSKGRKIPVHITEKISAANKGRKMSDEQKRKLSESRMGENNPMFGKSQSDESRQKRSESMKGRIFSDEHRVKISVALKGHKVCQETIEKFRAKLKGRKLSEETRQKMSEFQKQRWAKIKSERTNSGS